MSADEAPPTFDIPDADLWIDLAPDRARVRAELAFRRRGDARDLVLDGVGITLAEARLDGVALGPDRLQVTASGLTLKEAPDEGRLWLDQTIAVGGPGQEGLIRLGEHLITHCEPEGFRRICHFPDRPDVMTAFRCTLAADRTAFPTLLSNGDPAETGELPDGRHFVRWEDPRPKAAYLFALAAGRFGTLEDTFVTAAGRTVRLMVHAHPQDVAYCGHGLETLKRALAWDERAYGREYDLDRLNIVVLPSYPGGAMENRGLNLYATEFFLADPAISTDEQARRVTAIVGHEYFHNWTGNRVGVKSWRELALKEGFTVLRQQQFMADMLGDDEARIDDVVHLRDVQFPEDDGALAHAPRPETDVASNRYTRTVYDKSAEVLRMLQLLLGAEMFRRIAEAFFDRFDGTAARIEDLIATAEDVSGRDLRQFRRWFESAGGFHVCARWRYDPAAQTLALELTQSVRSADGPGDVGPLHAPVRIALLDGQGETRAFRLAGDNRPAATEQLLELRERRQVFVLEGVTCAPIPSLFRGLSAPVRLDAELAPEGLAVLAIGDDDAFTRWDAGQTLLRGAVAEARAGAADGPAGAAWRRVFADGLARALAAPGTIGRMLGPPSIRRLITGEHDRDPEAAAGALQAVSAELAVAFRAELRDLYGRLGPQAVSDEGARRMRALCLWQLTRAAEPQDVALCRAQLESPLMAEAAPALRRLVELGGATRDEALDCAFHRWRDLPAALDHWFAIQASAETANAADLVAALLRHPDWRLDNATRLKAVFDAFVLNARGFHRADGAGYRAVAEVVRALDGPNPRLAARFLKAFGDCAGMDEGRRAASDAALADLLAQRGLSAEVAELARRLTGAGPSRRPD